MATQARPTTTDPIRSAYDEAHRRLRAGALDDAESLCRRAQVAHPRDPNIQCLLGEVLLRQRKPQEARNWFGRVLKLFVDFPRALEGMGKAHLAEKQPNRAVQYLERAAKAVPNRSTTQLALGRALAMAGRAAEAEAAIDRGLALNPDKALVAQAAEQFLEGDVQQAETALRKHLASRPDDPLALRLLGKIALETQHRRHALRLLKRAVERAPDFILAWTDLAEAQMKEEDFDAALAAIDRAIELDPQLAHCWVTRGNILSKAQRHEEALVDYDRALDIHPVHAGALSGRGHVLKTIGRTPESIASYRECIRTHPAFGEAYWSLANLKTFSFEADEVDAMLATVERTDLADEPRVNLLYALGKHFENQADYDRAFDFYRRGATLRREDEIYDPVQNQVIHERIRTVFSREFMAERDGWGDPSPDPILIVGLPRSGSTLIEQILASHPEVEGTMELPDLSRCVREINRQARPRGQRKGQGRMEYPEAVERLDRDAVRALGERYIGTTRRFRTGCAYFIDKMPNNFTNLGLLHLILPNATVINARRHPLDSCLGSWKQLFYKGQSFTYDFLELGEFYLEYQAIMDHWHDVLPGKVLDVHYEDVVGDLDAQVKRILDHCGLAFDQRCLRFWETERAINTASSEQVRRPIYTSGVDFWRHYEKHLGELIEVLEPVLVGRYAVREGGGR